MASGRLYGRVCALRRADRRLVRLEIRKRGEEVGTSELLAPALAAAEAWFSEIDENTSPFEAETEQRRKVAIFTQSMCRVMRQSDVGEYVDEGPGFSLHASGDIGAIGAHYLYETCKRYKHTVFGDIGRWAHNIGYEAIACGQDMVQCAKTERQCLNSCSGVDNSDLNYDFHTIVGITELGVISLGAEGHAAAEANCSIKNTILEVPAFGGGEAFKTFAARLRVRSGMTAISSAWCTKSPLSCGVIQRTLERSPGLVYVNGAFRHRYDLVPPSPPPPPDPPPITLRYGPDPPSPPPPPLSPPPYFINAKNAFRCPRSPTSASTTPSSASTTPSRGARQLPLRPPRRRRAPPRVLVLRPRGRPAPAAAAVHEQQLALGELNLASSATGSASSRSQAPRKTDRAMERRHGNAIAKTQALIDSWARTTRSCADAATPSARWRRPEPQGAGCSSATPTRSR